MVCQKCGQNLYDDSRFCENCGALINEEPPEKVLEMPQANQKDNPGFATVAGSPVGSFPPNQQVPKKYSKKWLWIVLIALIVLICWCGTLTAGGFIYLRDNNLTLSDLISNRSEEQPQLTEVLITTLVDEEDIQPDVPDLSINTPVPEEDVQINPQLETPETTGDILQDTILVVTDSGIWAVNEQTKAANQISYDRVNAPWNLNQGMSPGKEFFAYITGFGGASTNPMLVVIDIANQTSIFQLELTGPNLQPGMDDSVGDAAFEAFRAMKFSGSIAWSPDGTQLAFVAARDANSADVYLLNMGDNSVRRLSEEAGQSYGLNWSPDGQFLEYLSAISFGTGVEYTMESLWVYDFQDNQPYFLENFSSSRETFLGWTDNSHFLIASQNEYLNYYNLRLVNAERLFTEVILDSCFGGIAFDPENKQGMFSVDEFNHGNCTNGEALDIGLMIFGHDIGYPVAGEIGWKKFEQIEAYSVSFVPQGNIFSIHGTDFQQYVFDAKFTNMEVPAELNDLIPLVSPNGNYWAWTPGFEDGLWVTTQRNMNLVEISAIFSGVPLWSQGGETLYFFEKNQVFSASAPQFKTELMLELSVNEILGLIN